MKMPRTAWRTIVGATAVKVADINDVSANSRIWIRNGTQLSVFLGGPGVTIDEGFELKANEVFGPLVVSPLFELWAVRGMGQSGHVHLMTD